jgi:PAS domain S-box-containing protein
MSLRRDLAALLPADDAVFRSRIVDVFDAYDGVTDRREAVAAGPDAVDPPAGLDAVDALDPRDRALVWRVQLLEDAPLGITLSGPAYGDNPIVYANETFRALTGYAMRDLRGENPRLLQGPDTEPAAVADLREALSTWQPVTVDLRNYRRDGTPFDNRVSLVPVTDDAGTVTNWFGIQAALTGGTEDTP